MRDVKLTVTARGNVVVPGGTLLGRKGELGATRLLIDVSAWAEGAVEAYSVAGARADGVTWVIESGLVPAGGVLAVVVPDALLASAGLARIEVRGEASGVLVKSAAVMLPVRDALTDGEAPTDAEPAWIDRLSQAGVALGAQIEGGGALRDEMQELADQTAEYAKRTADDRSDAQEASTAASERADDAQVAQQGAEQARDASQGHAVNASESADRAESAYARVVGIDLVVDVVSGELRLYSAGMDSAIDIEMVGNTLEVYQL